MCLFDEHSAQLLTPAAGGEYADDMQAVIGHSSRRFVRCHCGQKAVQDDSLGYSRFVLFCILAFFRRPLCDPHIHSPLSAAAGHFSTIQIILTCLPLSASHSDPCGEADAANVSAASASSTSRAYERFVSASCGSSSIGVSSACISRQYFPLLCQADDPCQEADGRWSPLQFCVVQRHPIATKLLVFHGADPTVRLGTALKTALDVAFKAFKVGPIRLALLWLCVHDNISRFVMSLSGRSCYRCSQLVNLHGGVCCP